MGVTLKDVAARAGVSRATASVVLRGGGRISAPTADRVRAAMAELGYVYDRSAAALRQHRTMTIGLVMTDLRNPFFAELAMALEDAVHRAGYTVLIGYSRDEERRQAELVGVMAERRVDAVVLLPAQGTDGAGLDPLAARRVPVVMVARHVGTGAPYVGPDNLRAGELLGRHLRELGVRAAALVGGPADSSARAERLAGLRAGAAGAVTVDGECYAGTTAAAGAHATSRLLEEGPTPDCLIGYNDVVATGVGAVLRERGLEPGRDVALAGFDDIPAAAHHAPPLTTVATHPERVGAACAQVLLAAVTAAGPVAGAVVEPTLRVRASTTAWRGPASA